MDTPQTIIKKLIEICSTSLDKHMAFVGFCAAAAFSIGSLVGVCLGVRWRSATLQAFVRPSIDSVTRVILITDSNCCYSHQAWQSTPVERNASPTAFDYLLSRLPQGYDIWHIYSYGLDLSWEVTHTLKQIIRSGSNTVIHVFLLLGQNDVHDAVANTVAFENSELRQILSTKMQNVVDAIVLSSNGVPVVITWFQPFDAPPETFRRSMCREWVF